MRVACPAAGRDFTQAVSVKEGRAPDACVGARVRMFDEFGVLRAMIATEWQLPTPHGAFAVA